MQKLGPGQFEYRTLPFLTVLESGKVEKRMMLILPDSLDSYKDTMKVIRNQVSTGVSTSFALICLN
ncbi:MAG: hypothetical protein ACFFGZ_04670 [Candidatus Thorarchaeota archaeon]